MSAAIFSHLERGTHYGESGVEAYAQLGHGSDMHQFLRPYVAAKLEKLSEKRLLDAGCGACPYAIYAALHGAQVDAIDIQPGMVRESEKAIAKVGLLRKINVQLGDATNMGFESDTFDHAISVNVGCNLPGAIFIQHFQEIGRTLKSQGTATITAPYSLDTVFTDGAEKIPVGEHIVEVLSSLPENPSPDLIREKLKQLQEITSATFTIQAGRLVLVTDIKELESGQPIWRKLTHVIIPNYFHSDIEYQKAFKKADLDVVSTEFGHFTNSLEREAFNANPETSPKLGPAYDRYAPFIVYSVVKQ